jgi:uncharacterized phage protein gp47/JayE
MAGIREFVVKDAIAIRDDILRTIKNGLIKQGVASPNVGPNSDWYIIATSVGNEMAVVGANAVVKAEQLMPDSATGADLERIAAIFDLEKQPAAGSIGPVVIEASADSPITTGRRLTDSAGLIYEVVIGGTYADEDSVTIRAVSKGYDTNHAEGDVLQWETAPPYCSDKVTVGEGGLVNGIDAEDDETLRARLLALLQTPPGAGNWEHVAEVAEESTSSVQKAFVYPALEGPATLHVAVAAAPTDTNKSREVASATMTGTVDPFVKGKLPTHAYVVVTTVADVEVDVAIGLSLPEAATANPPGPGGGWTNGTPWPAPDGTSSYIASVLTVTSTTQFSVFTDTAPTANVSRIMWLSPYDWTLYSALVTSYTAPSGPGAGYEITIDTAFPDIAVGCYVWPECQNAQTYIDELLAEFALMGPGEKTSNASALVRGFRHPTTGGGWAYKLGPAMLRAVTNAGDEVLAAQFLYRTDGTTTALGSSGTLTPQVPGSVSNPPNIFTPRHIGFYRIET